MKYFCFALTLLFVAGKIFGKLMWSWIWVPAPLYFYYGGLLLLGGILSLSHWWTLNYGIKRAMRSASKTASNVIQNYTAKKMQK